MKHEFPAGFDPQPTLTGSCLSLRPLIEEDRNPLTQAASDPDIWLGHPAKDRHLQAVFDRYFNALLDIGGCLVIQDDEQDVLIGCSAYYTDTNARSRLSIGFTFLACAYWGGKTNWMLKQLMLEHLFEQSSQAWFHIAPTNLRSQAATKKLGAVQTHEDMVDLGGGEQQWRCYCLTREAWKTRASVAA